MYIYILTCKAYPKGNLALQNLATFLSKKGFFVNFIIWQKLNLKNLDEKNIILPLAIWDYSEHFKEFQSFLESLKISKAKVFNDVDLLKYNASKLYLKELASKGLDTIPSAFLDSAKSYQENILSLGFNNLIIKPLVGQSGNGVRKFSLDEFTNPQNKEKLKAEFKNGALVQEYIKGIKNGEFCFVFFDSNFFYAIKRKVANEEWRANSNFKVQISLLKNYDKSCLELAYNVVHSLKQSPLYARVDIILDKNKPLVNELELIEPNLYFDYKNGSLEAFYTNLLQRL